MKVEDGQEVSYIFEPARVSRPFPAASKAAALPFIRFVDQEQQKRWNRRAAAGFDRVADLLHQDREYFYIPRYSSPEYFFGGEAKNLGFLKKRGLDVGCRSMMTPHYMQYSFYFQMEMFGVDVFLDPDMQTDRVVTGDVKNLPFANDYFDFATVAMIFGLGRPSDTILEIAAGLSELRRTVRGFVYLADRHVMPEVVFAGQQLGFRTLIVDRAASAKSGGAFPIGTYLVKDTLVFPLLIAQLLLAGKELPYSLPEDDLRLPQRHLD